MIKYSFFSICVLISFLSMAQIDKKATRETRHLYRHLLEYQYKGVMFGHQDGLAYGLNEDGTRWIGEDGRSDVMSVSGEYPAVLGWDLGKIEFDNANNLDGVPFLKIQKYIQETYDRGGISTISWHFNNPTDPKKSSWDKADSTIKHIFDNKNNLKRYKSWLDKVAVFLKSLKGANGELIPIIFRPFHEHTGSWFWWGSGHCTPEEYIKMWKFTINYLQKKKKVHNLLIAYSTDKFNSKEHYLERYPGNDFVDLVGFDLYHRNAPISNESFKVDFKRMVNTLQEIATETNKPCAITEMGLEQLTEANWWTNIVLPVVQDTKLSYILVWRNGRTDHFYAPYKGQKSAEDFMKMIQSGKVILEKQTAARNLYKQ
ncbi:glycoside hydrolase family 26 protein [Emticicia sp. SJ17W-69]|uniref:glycoside hydrolase family 26 protein n=1 Tax=Emticicia sp. SJ17W-69 TaxID=3421657 RepID=UPI003EBD075E